MQFLIEIRLMPLGLL